MKETQQNSDEWLKLVTLSESQVKELIHRKLSRAYMYSPFIKNVNNRCKCINLFSESQPDHIMQYK